MQHTKAVRLGIFVEREILSVVLYTVPCTVVNIRIILYIYLKNSDKCEKDDVT